MSDYTLVISENLYDKARRIAEQTARPVDELIRARLEESFNSIPLDLADDERAELNALTHLSNDTLWTIAREQMPSVQQDVMQELMDKNNFGTIIPTEFDQLMQFVEGGQRLMTRKAEAMKLLMNRGYTVTLDALKPPNE